MRKPVSYTHLLINREMVNASDVQNARQGTLINPTIYDKIPTDYVSVESGTLQFKWLDIDGNPVAGNYSIRENVIENNESYDYGGKMIYEKSDLVKTAQWKPIYESGRLYENGTKPFDDLIIDANHTMKTHYTVKTYTIIDNSTGKPITMNKMCIRDSMNSLTNSSGEKYQAVSLADPQSAIRFEVGTGTTSMMIPSYLQIDGLLKVNSNNAYIGLVASNIYLSPDLLNSSKIKTIDLYSATGTKIQSVSYTHLDVYKRQML